MKRKCSKYFNYLSVSRIIVIPLALGLVFAIGCASKKGVTKSTQENPPTTTQKPTPVPTPVVESDASVTKKSTKEETVPGDEGNLSAKTEPIAEIGTVYFDFDKYDLSETARTTLAKNAQWLKKNTDFRIRVEGNCDERGTVEYNLALGEKRANATKDYYVSLGISANRIQTISYGKERSVDPGHTEDAWSKNRRADTVKVVQ